MKSKKGPILLIVSGSLLTLGPCWGLLGTVIGMIRAFQNAGQNNPGNPERLASSMGIALWSTAIGIMMVPIGIALLVVGIIWLMRVKKQDKSVEPDAPSYGSPARRT